MEILYEIIIITNTLGKINVMPLNCDKIRNLLEGGRKGRRTPSFSIELIFLNAKQHRLNDKEHEKQKKKKKKNKVLTSVFLFFLFFC